MKIKNVTIGGGGTLGSQIVWQTAFKGFNVIVYDAFDKGIEASKLFHRQFAKLFKTTRKVSGITFRKWHLGRQCGGGNGAPGNRQKSF